MADYDVCVIGAGPAGFAATMRLWDFGKRVCLIERGRLGGAGIHNGALSSKTLWELSCDYRGAKRRDRGYVANDLHVSFEAVMQVVEQAIDTREGHMRRQLRALAEPDPEHGGRIALVQGTARFVDRHTVQVEGTEVGDHRRITADHFIVATGSHPRTLPEVEVDGERIITSDHVGRLRRFPRSLVILGAGVVGCELATIFANFGHTKVYLIDRAERILPFEDPDVSRVCSTNLELKGVTIHHRAKLISMRAVGEEVEYTIEHHTGGRETIRVEKALVSIGRLPNTEGLGLEEIGVRLGRGGHVEVDDTRTTVPHVHAVGDTTLDMALVSVGEIEGRHAAEIITGHRSAPLQYDNLSTIMFLDPEVAAIGLNEQQAQERRTPYRVASYHYSLVSRPIAMRATDGFVKLLTTDDDELKILGMRALGVHSSTMLEAISLMMRRGCSACDLAELLHPHPAVTEGLQDCVRMLMGSSIYKPQVFQSELRLSRIGYDDSEPSPGEP